MEIHFEIENRCLLRCRHCSSYAADYGKAMSYSINDMINFIKIFTDKKHIFLTGGEPLLCEKFEIVISELTNEFQNVSIGAFTTGIVEHQGQLCAVSKEQAYNLAKSGLKMCYFSLYSANADEHDWMTGIEGSFELTLESIRRMIEQNIEGKINLVVTKRNREKINDIIALAADFGCTEVRLLKLINHGKAQSCWSEIGLPDTEYYESVKNAVGKYRNIQITAAGCTDILPCRPFKEAQGCQAGSQLVYVTYEGNIFPCASVKNNLHYQIGKLGEIESLQEYFEIKSGDNKIALCRK